MKPIITVEELGKSYTIRHEGQTRYKSLREEIFKLPQRLLRRNGQSQEEFWALKDVSFDVMPGERVGIIGRNGAGKSTLLKLLSRITEPSAGRIILRGRVASLLEVGTGFHPELTGRENIFLNGAILGMSRAEVRKKFDEIVDFAGVEKFLDTPVKRYSSGMYVRLAFAVAAHLEPEILIVDEVLAVGDAEFQKKCLGKMEEVSKGGGRTVLFVSHNMNAVQTLCNKAIWIDTGRIKRSGGDLSAIIGEYTSPAASSTHWTSGGEFRKNPYFSPHDFSLRNAQGLIVNSHVSADETFYFHASGEVLQTNSSFNIGIAVYNKSGECLFWSFTTDQDRKKWPGQRKGQIALRVVLPPHLLNEGEYTVELLASIHNVSWVLAPGETPARLAFELRGGLSDSPFWIGRRPGLLAPILPWEYTTEKV